MTAGVPGDNDTVVAQASWNLDPLDGTGPSGLTYGTSDWQTCQLFVIDFQWLGVGRIRYGIYYAGVIRYVHEILNTGNTAPFMKLGKLPVRYEITSNGGGAAGEMRMICASVMSEGGSQTIGNTWSYTSLAAKRKQPGVCNASEDRQQPHDGACAKCVTNATGNTAYIAWELIRIPSADYTPSGGWVDSGSPAIEYNVNGTVVTTNQVKIWGEVSLGRNQSSVSLDIRLSTPFPLVSEIDGTSFIYVIHTVQTTSQSVGISVCWNEMR